MSRENISLTRVYKMLTHEIKDKRSRVGKELMLTHRIKDDRSRGKKHFAHAGEKNIVHTGKSKSLTREKEYRSRGNIYAHAEKI